MVGLKDSDAFSEDNLRRFRAEAHFERARGYFRNGRFEEALAVLDEAVAADPSFSRAKVARAYALRRLGLLPEALCVVNDVLRANDRDALALAAKGAVLQALSREEEAKEVFEQALAAADAATRPLVIYNYACFWSAAGDAEMTQRYLSYAVQCDPTKKSVAAVDRDFEAFRGERWFQDIVSFGP